MDKERGRDSEKKRMRERKECLLDGGMRTKSLLFLKLITYFKKLLV